MVTAQQVINAALIIRRRVPEIYVNIWFTGDTASVTFRLAGDELDITLCHAADEMDGSPMGLSSAVTMIPDAWSRDERDGDESDEDLEARVGYAPWKAMVLRMLEDELVVIETDDREEFSAARDCFLGNARHALLPPEADAE